jgi:hypothetical protein
MPINAFAGAADFTSASPIDAVCDVALPIE